MSKNEEDHIADLKETFANLRVAGLKLNPEKCVFSLSRGKMLRYIIGPEGIRANLEKTKVIMTRLSLVGANISQSPPPVTFTAAFVNSLPTRESYASLPLVFIKFCRNLHSRG
jgi:hypothetical protein